MIDTYWTHELWVCVDCMLTREQGEMPEDRDQDREPWSKITNLDVAANWDSNDEADKGHLDFSDRWCDACGTGLAGDRYRYAARETEDDHGNETLGSCGCTDYHMADCPLRTGNHESNPTDDYDPYDY